MIDRVQPEGGRARRVAVPAIALAAEPAAEPAQGGGAMQAMIVPLLTVELLLLAFFILLNAVSNLEVDRARSVLDSVQAALGVDVEERVETPALPDPDLTLAEVEQQIATLVRAVGAAIGTPVREDELWIDLPVQALFRTGEDRLKTAQSQFIARLSALLAQTPADHGYEITVLRGEAEASLEDDSLRLRQAAAIAAALRAAVEPRGTVAAGLLPEAAIGVRLALRWHPARS